jgi:hypothetical protein
MLPDLGRECDTAGHPGWDVYPVTDFAADVDWGPLYNSAWRMMNGREPAVWYSRRGRR